MRPQSLVSLCLVAPLVLVAACAVAPSDDVASASAPSQAMIITRPPPPAPPGARFDVRLPIGGCVSSVSPTADAALKSQLQSAFAPYFPNADVISVCGTDLTQRYGVFESVAPSPLVEDLRAGALTEATTILQSNASGEEESFAADFTAGFVSDAVAAVWATTDKTLPGGPFSSTAIIVSEVQLETESVALASNTVSLTIAAEAYASVLSLGWAWHDETLVNTDTLSLAPQIVLPAACDPTAQQIACVGSNPALPDAGCPFTSALPLEVLIPDLVPGAAPAKYVLDYDRVASNATDITAGAFFVDCARAPGATVTATTPIVTVDGPGATQVGFTLATRDLRAPLTVQWSIDGTSVTDTTQTTTDARTFTVTVPASIDALPYLVAEVATVRVTDADGQVVTASGQADAQLDIADRNVCRNKPYLPQCQP